GGWYHERQPPSSLIEARAWPWRGVQLWRDAEHSAEFANRRRRQDVRLGLARFHFAPSKNYPHNTNY
ncbi:MAG TPA: hypothetical protein VNO32_34190, partial [Candidatus Acidoferrum sp.]|nr:hypothetical protein [Candidatus Acidoferrum sp.]